MILRFIGVLTLFFLAFPVQAQRYRTDYAVFASADALLHWEYSSHSAFNTDVDANSVPEDVWAVGGQYAFPAAAAATTIVSSSTSDDAGQVGCLQVMVKGLIAGYVDTTEIVVLDGTTPVSLANSYLRINQAECTLTGSSANNAGDIDILHGATILGRIPINSGQLQQAILTAPAAKAFFIDVLRISIERIVATSVTVHVQTRNASTGTAWKTISVAAAASTGASLIDLSPPPGRYIVLFEKTDFRIRVTSASANDIQVTADIQGFKIDGGTVLTVPSSL